MSDITAGYVFANGATFTPTKLNAMLDDAVIAAGALSADATGRAKMADGFLSADATGLAKMADGFLTADTAGRAKMADGYVTLAKHDSTSANGHAKAWISFAGATGSVRGTAFNLSVSRTSAGYYRLTFGSTMADANYSVLVTTSATAGAPADIRQSLGIIYSTTAPTTGYFEILTGNAISGSLTDAAIVNVVVFGN